MQPDPGPHRPAPILTDDNAFYWEGAAAGRLLAQRCGECAIVRHPPRPMCPHCHSLAVDVIRLSGRGTLYSYAILHHPQSPVFDYPVRAALVDLEEGIRVLAELTEIATDDLYIGMPLQVSFAPTVDGHAVPVFSPLSGSPVGDR